ncbi:MAG: transpeptidase family protein [Hydrogenibacillus sp.]|nr:transpeptidase family protein [Hydrogenibacillus sp.]
MNGRRMTGRGAFVGMLFFLFFLSVITRLVYLQAFDPGDLKSRAYAQWLSKESIPAKRGTIYDRHGTPLAVDGPAYNVVAVLSPEAPSHVVDVERTAEALAPLIDMSAERLTSIMRQSGRYQVEFRPGGWKVSPEVKEAIEQLRLPGIVFVEDRRRYYPFGAFLAHTLGYVDKDGTPRMGLEAALDDVLAGQNGQETLLVDNLGRPLPAGVQSYEPPIDGKDVVLTIDRAIQQFVEEALDHAAERFRAAHMLAVVVNPKTMEVYALASRPHFDPNDYSRIENYINLPVSFTFEPGSTFKTITLAAAINEGVYHPEETYQAGVYQSKEIRPPIRDWNSAKGWGTITFAEAFARSSNVGMTILGYERLGRSKLAQYYDAFGFGAKTGIDIPGEASGKLPDMMKAPPRDIATTTYGQTLTVTPMQMVTAVSAAINGGKLMKPYVIERIERHDDGIVLEEHGPTFVRQVITPQASAKVREAMLSVVASPDGTGRAYALDGYRIAGKTGTAQKLGADGRYKAGAYIYSFIGFAPLDDPEVLVYVVVDEPDIEAPTSGEVVSPIFKEIMAQTLTYLNVPPDAAPDESGASKPKTDAKKAAGKPQTAESPAEGTGNTGESDPAGGRLPDFRGQSKRDVARALARSGLVGRFDGEGFAVAQDPAPGSPVTPGQTVHVTFAPAVQTPAESSPSP